MRRGTIRLVVGLILLGSLLPNTLTAGHGYYLVANAIPRERQTADDDSARGDALLAPQHRPAQLNCPLGTHQPSAEQHPAGTQQDADGQGAGNKEHDHTGHMVTVVAPSQLRSLEDAFLLNKGDAVLRPLPPDILIVADAHAAPIDPPPRSL
mgnify:CR=1 FL=1